MPPEMMAKREVSAGIMYCKQAGWNVLIKIRSYYINVSCSTTDESIHPYYLGLNLRTAMFPTSATAGWRDTPACFQELEAFILLPLNTSTFVAEREVELFDITKNTQMWCLRLLSPGASEVLAWRVHLLHSTGTCCMTSRHACQNTTISLLAQRTAGCLRYSSHAQVCAILARISMVEISLG